MIIEKILGNLHEQPVENLHIEKVVLPGADLVKRVQRVTTDHGRELGLRLKAPAGPAGDLRDGDILLREGNNLVVVGVKPTDVLVIKPRSITQMGFVAHSLGNRHLQAQFFDADSEYGAEVMVVQYDHTVQQFLDAEKVAYHRAERVMPVAFRHAEHTH